MNGDPLRVEGREHRFDFTHLDDTVAGLCVLIELLAEGDRPPPLHIVTGRPTTLQRLAELAVASAASTSRITDGPPRTYDVSRFTGDPTRAKQILGWTASTSIEQGMARLVDDFAAS